MHSGNKPKDCGVWHRWPALPALIVSAVLVSFIPPVVGKGGATAEPLHLVFPDFFATWSERAQHQYVLGVIDARASALTGNSALPEFVKCVVTHGVGKIAQVIADELVPRIGAAGTPMPYLIDQAIRDLCP